MKIEPLTDAEMNMSVEEWATALMEDPSCMRTYLLAAEARGRTLAQQEARAAALEEAAKLAETWGHAPPNPHGRRAALAAGIRALLEGK